MVKKNVTPRLITDLRPGAKKPVYQVYAKRAQRLVKKYPRYVLVAVVVVVIAVFLLVHHSGSNNKTTAGQKKIDDTVTQVGKLILLPSGEQPTLAIINDASKYKNSSFFKNAANGDRLLVYAQAREAILYRPSINKIIAVAPLNPDVAPQSSTPNQ